MKPTVARTARLLKPRRRFEQRRFEGQNSFAAGTCAFGKEHNHHTGAQCGFDFVPSLRRLCASLAVNEHGSREPSEPTEHGPMLHVALGDKHAGGERCKEKNIEIAKMVADQQAAGWDFANGPYSHSKNSQHRLDERFSQVERVAGNKVRERNAQRLA